MDLSFSESQEMLRKSARHFLQKECPKALVREMAEDEKGYSSELWRKMADLGWMGLIFPEKYGGADGNFLDLVVLLEEMGRACLPGPFLSTILGAILILEIGREDQKEELLPKVAKGEKTLTLALSEPEFRYDPSTIMTRAAAQAGDYIIDGVKLFVPYAHVADYMVCVTRTADGASPEEGITLFLVDTKSSGISYSQLKTIGGDRQSEVVFDKVRVSRENMLGDLHQAWPTLKEVLQKAAVAKCAEMVGISEQVLEMAVNYAKKRVQFGRPIGSFQAIQHHCANMLIDADGSKLVTYKAAWMISEGIPCDIEVATAKTWVSEACRRVTALGHQVIGGVSVIIDHNMPLYYRRAKAAEVAFGDADFYRDMIVSRRLAETRPKSWLLS